MKYPLASVRKIRSELQSIPGCISGEPHKDRRDLGEFPHQILNSPQLEYDPSLSEIEYPFQDIEPTTPIFEISPKANISEIKKFISEKAGNNFDALFKQKNIDAFGWYFPFHNISVQHGIYISTFACLKIAIEIFKKPILDDEIEDLKIKLELAFDAIRRHEAFHFGVECAIANWELLFDRPIYTQAQKILCAELGYSPQEECLANAYMLRGFIWSPKWRRGKNVYRELFDVVKNSPKGYCGGVDSVNSVPFWENTRYHIIDHFRKTIEDNFYSEHLLPPTFFFEDAVKIDDSRCPLILVDEYNIFSFLGITARFITKLDSIERSAAFQKSLDKLGKKVTTGWEKVEIHLRYSTTIPSLDFKRWPPRGKDWFSVRVDRSMRAHIRLEGSSGKWIAEEIGTHDEMGH